MPLLTVGEELRMMVMGAKVLSLLIVAVLSLLIVTYRQRGGAAHDRHGRQGVRADPYGGAGYDRKRSRSPGHAGDGHHVSDTQKRVPIMMKSDRQQNDVKMSEVECAVS